MKCARLQLQDRFKPKVKPEVQVTRAEKQHPRRYCQKRMVNPEHEEDPRWTDVYQRYHCYPENDQSRTISSARRNDDTSDMFLTVQTLRFQGDVDQTKKVRASFKYKVPTDGAKHRMFVKQAVDNEYYNEEDRSSQLTSYYFDDYVKYLFNNDKSRPDSGKSSIFLQGLSNKRENKAIQVDTEQSGESNKISHQYSFKLKGFLKKSTKQDSRDETKYDTTNGDDTKKAFCKSGKRRSLTLSRAQSPETVHVIRVDVVCNNNGSAPSYSKEKKIDYDSQMDVESLQTKRSYFADKYLLTSAMKKLDENLSGAKVTLLCKTFRLTERAKTYPINYLKANSDKKCTANEMKTRTIRRKLF